MDTAPDTPDGAPVEQIDYQAECIREKQAADTFLRVARTLLESDHGRSVPNRDLIAEGLYLLERDGPGWLESHYGRLAAKQEQEYRARVRTEVQESFSEFVGPQWWYPDESLGSRAFAPMTYTGDRRGGIMWPIFRTEMELNIIRGQARLVVERIEYAKGALNTLTDYVIGSGYEYTATAIKGMQAPPGLVEAVQRVIDEFIESNKWGDLERELFTRRRRDGERFLRFFHVGCGETQVRTVEPEQVTESGHDSVDTEDDIPGVSWLFGVHCRAEDTQSVLGYNLVWDTYENTEYVPADEIQHCKTNVDRVVKRGLTDFYTNGDTLEGARKLLRNTREGAAIQAAIAFIKQYPAGTSQSTVQAQNAAQMDYSQPRVSAFDARRQINVQRYDPGTVLSIPKGLEYLAGPMGSSNAPNYMLTLQGTLRSAGVIWQMPEGMISGDASNNNYASALVSEGPFNKRIRGMQAQEAEDNTAVIKKAVRIAADEGRFSRWGVGYDLLMRLVKIQCVTPAVEARDNDKETNRRAVLHANRILSPQTWAQQEELDPDVEEENFRRLEGAQKAAADAASGAEAQKPTPEERTSLAAIEGALECCQSLPEARDIVRAAAHRRYP